MNYKSSPFWVKFLFVGFAIMYGVISYWMLWPYNPITVKTPIKILNENKQLYPGDFLVYELDIDKRMNLPAKIYKQLINHFIITYSPIIGNVPTGKRKWVVRLKIPDHAEIGDYTFKWEGVYKVNPIREIRVVATSEPFKVVNPS